MEDFDIIIVGGGHAGAEAARAAASMGMSVGLFSINLDSIGRMPCSPSIGGLAKSHLVKEIDAMGGIMAEVADETAIHYKVLNTKKGPAVRATRTQNDRRLYEMGIKARLERTSGVHLRQARVDRIVVKDSIVRGIIDHIGNFYQSRAVIITAGTFLKGTIHLGEKRIPAGRAGEEGAYELAESLKSLGLKMGRHKTGTPPRLLRESIDFSAMMKQETDQDYMPLSFSAPRNDLPRLECYLTKTTGQTHEIISKNIGLSPLYSGAIKGLPARYCPSLEDKVMKFGERGGHQVIIEPEGINTNEVYASGLGNSMPVDIQWEIVRSIPGLDNAEILRPAYAIEYDFIYPTQLLPTLETRIVGGLFLAGQVNGTSGYEEAAAQGMIAGINAALRLRGESPFVPARQEAYAGVMVDDLTTRGTTEPYRMFTSRAEYRLMLRETNALFRLSEYALKLGLIDRQRHAKIMHLLDEINHTREELSKRHVYIAGGRFYNEPKVDNAEKLSAERLLRRPGVSIKDLIRSGIVGQLNPVAAVEVEVEIKYDGYIKRQLKEIEKLRGLEKKAIPPDIDYNKIPGLSNELKERLNRLRPRDLSQASRVEGMTPAGLQALSMGIRLINPL